MRSYLQLLRRPGAANVLAGQAIGRLTPGMMVLAIILALRQGGYAYAAVGLVAGAHQFGVGIGSPVQGRLADVLGHRAVLLPDAAVYLVGTATLTFGIARAWPVWALVAAGVATGLASPPMTACARAALGSMFSTGREREQAFILTGANVEFGFLVGPLATVAVAGLAGPGFAILVAGAAVAVGAVVYSSGPRIPDTGARPVIDGSSRWRTGTAGAWRSTGLRRMVLVYLGISTSFGAFDLFAAAVAEDAGRPGAAGALISLIAFASLVSGFVYGARVWRGTLQERLRMLAALFLVSLVLMPFVAGELLLLAVVAALSGAILGPLNVCGFQLTDDVAPPTARAEAQSWTQAAVYLGGSVGGALAGVVVDLAGSHATMLVGAAGVLGAFVVLSRSQVLREDTRQGDARHGDGVRP